VSRDLLIICPSCQSKNRVPVEKLEARPACGRCKAPLFQGHPVELDSVGFQRMVENSDQPVLVDFWAPWCGPCVQMAPQLAAATTRLEPQIRVVKVDIEANQDVGAAHRVQSIPTLALFHGGREIARRQGSVGAMEIVRFVAEAVG
jgi:thioredoxin 2